MRWSHALFAVVFSLSLVPSGRAAAAPARSKLLQNTTGKTVIRKVIQGNDLTVAVISKSGVAAVCDPANMPAGVVPDVITISHAHHVNKPYLEEAKGVPALQWQTGTWTFGDVRVTGVPGAHSEAPPAKGPPAFAIYIFEVDGLRIANFVCEGQQHLEPDQLAALGRVDVALITAGRGDGLSPAHAHDLMKQIGARIVIPLSHHSGDPEYDLDTMAELSDAKLETVNGELALTPKDLEGKPPRLVHIAPTLAP